MLLHILLLVRSRVDLTNVSERPLIRRSVKISRARAHINLWEEKNKVL